MKKKIDAAISIVLVICSFLAAGKVWAREEVATSPIPDWVTKVVVPEVKERPIDKIQDGVHYLLLDSQIKAGDKPEFEYFFRMAEYIINPEGVDESSQISIDYDPEYQKVTLHTLNVIRDGQVLNKLNTARIDHIRREEEMDESVYHGQLTLNILLDDIRVGDVVEYSYTRSGVNPVYQGIFAYSSSLNWSVPLERLYLRILWEKQTPLYSSILNSDLELKQKDLGGAREYVIEDNKLDPVKSDDGTPSWFSPWGAIYFSEQATWEAVGVWGLGLYQGVFNVDAEIAKLVADIKLNHKDKSSQISAALRFVQEEIRYLGIELGENSHKPRPASTTLRYRYGDCKDKTVLFLTLLKELGVDGYPALVNTETRLKDRIPSVRSFDHVISYFEFEDKEYWVDPTRSYQHGDLSSIFQPDYGKALILRPGTDDLVNMEPDFAKYGVFVKDEFTVLDDGPATFTTTTVNYGKDAERQRQRLASNGRDQIQTEYLEFFEDYYPGIEVAALIELEDNPERNIFTSHEQYKLENFWEDKPDRKRHEVDFYANIVSPWVSEPDDQDRHHPLALSYPEHIEQVIEIHFEGDDWFFDSEYFEEDNSFFYFKNEVSYQETSKTLSLKYIYRSKVDHVKPSEYQAYVEAINKLKNQLSYGIYQSYENTSGDTESGFLSQLSLATYIYIYAAMYVFLVFMWRFDRWKNPVKEDTIFYPVSLGKLTAMWVFTFGIFGVYWFYRNFKYIREQERSAIMPLARGIFNKFWYFPLWNKLREDSENRYGKSYLPNKRFAVVLAITFLISPVLGRYTGYPLVFQLLTVLTVLPLANYLLFVNGDKSPAVIEGSKWRARHALLVVLSLPVCGLVVGGEFGFLASDKVVEGSEISDRDLKFMQRKGILKATDEVAYFYSDALLFVSEDGNGFTQRHVFSYWKDGDILEKEMASYEDIEDLQVDWSSSLGDTTTVTVVRKDGSDFILYVSNLGGKDKVFISSLKERLKAVL
ncbi:DUF3857 domain-containing transglutaminase family protein [Microbulbifer sp. VVAC002]|uniref:DUF3857 domain-containing transglutaminase family protein n=1 Tax=Microbulbifer sp. VVAC002 TaxID=3243387 RepID=UPI004039CA4F